MEAFEYTRPATKEDAVKLLAGGWGETEVLAGGTDLLSLMKDYVSKPKRLVSLSGISGLKGLSFSPTAGLRIGATTTLQELAANASVRKQYPALVEAAQGVRSPQIQSAGTVGGDLLQRPRCWYYRGGHGLLASHNGKPLVPGGENQYHAILGNSGPAYFVNPSSFAPALIALGAKVRLLGPSGPREVALEKFFRAPQGENEREYDVKPNEILTDILVPATAGAQSAVYEVREKEALDWPLAAAAVSLSMSGKTVKSARVVLGHVAPVPWISAEAEAALVGKMITESVADEAGNAAVAKATPLSKNGYKVQLARVAVKRAILAAGGA